MRSVLGTAGLVVAIVAACGNSRDPEPGSAAGRRNGEAGEDGKAGDASGTLGGSAGGKGGASGKGGSGGKAGGTSTGGAGGTTGGSAGTTSAEAGGGGMLGEPGSLLPSHGKGTRLAVKELRSGDMPPVFVTFHDTELDLDCRFVLASDGTQRCLPPYTPRMPLRTPQVFLDEDCTVPIAMGDSECVAEEDAYFTETEPLAGGCQTREERVFRATLLEDGVELFTNAGGDCAEQGITGGAPHYFRFEEVDPSNFVEGSTEIVETPTRLSVERLVATDGAFQTLALADPSVDRECRVFGEEETWFCVPAPVWSGRDYRTADEECSVPLSIAICSEPLYVADIDPNDRLVFARAGAEHTGAVYGQVNACELVTGEGPFYAIGESVAASEFPNVTTARHGSGRLRHLVYSDAAGTELAAGTAVGSLILSEGGLFDTSLDETCSLRRYTDLEQYCVPDSVTTESPNNLYYVDSDCTEQVAVCGEQGCPRGVALLAGNGEGAVCGVIPDFVKVLTLGDPLALDEIYIWYGGREPGMECDGPFSTEGYGAIREITGETGVDDFAELTPATD
jgi:hypothetical protein